MVPALRRCSLPLICLQNCGDLYYGENMLQLWGSTLEERVVAVEQELATSFVHEDFT